MVVCGIRTDDEAECPDNLSGLVCDYMADSRFNILFNAMAFGICTSPLIGISLFGHEFFSTGKDSHYYVGIIWTGLSDGKHSD